jgi:hypothetical protein
MRRILLFLILALIPCLLQAQQTYPTGTDFEENFGNATVNPQACWSGASGQALYCNQLWTVTQGSGQAIVTAPSGWSGYALELPSASTVIKMYTYGTFPLIPKNTGWTITVTTEVSAWASATTYFQALSYGTGGSIEASFGLATNGFYFPSNGGTHCPGNGTGATNTITLSSNGTSVTASVNGSACGNSWSDPGYPIGSLYLEGNASVNIYFQQITVNGFTVTGSWPPSFYVNFNGQYGNSVTTTTMQAGTVCNYNAQNGGATGDWTLSSGSGITWAFIQGGQPFASNLLACGGAYNGKVNVALQMGVANSGTPGQYFGNAFYTVYTILQAGMYIQLVPTGALGGSGHNIDTFVLGRAGTNAYNTMFLGSTSGECSSTNCICFENDQGGGTAPCSSGITSSTWYWQTFDVTGSGGTNYLWVFNVNANGQVTSLLSQVQESGTHEAFAGGTFNIEVGKTGDEVINNTANVIYSNVIVNATSLVAGPLMPPAGPASTMMIARLVDWESRFQDGRSMPGIFRVQLVEPSARKPRAIRVNWSDGGR